jgi:HTH-type transcriptional regulator/antitoxin HigA
VRQEEHERLLAIAEDFMRRSMTGDLSPDEERVFDLIAVLIEHYERDAYPMPEKQPRDLLKFLMEQSGTKAIDLVPIFGSRGYVSDILSGRRRIPREKAKALGERFGLQPAAFYERD